MRVGCLGLLRELTLNMSRASRRSVSHLAISFLISSRLRHRFQKGRSIWLWRKVKTLLNILFHCVGIRDSQSRRFTRDS